MRRPYSLRLLDWITFSYKTTVISIKKKHKRFHMYNTWQHLHEFLGVLEYSEHLNLVV